MGILSDFFGFSDKQVVEDVERGDARARNDAEVAAKADWMVESASDSSSSGSGKEK